jgi:DNA-binding NarL/FixJ family response regulator
MGFVSKSEPPSVMVGAVQLVLGGGLYVPPALAGPGFDGRLPSAPEARLTARQVEVVRLLVEGRTNKEMATALQLSGATVKAHLAAVFRELGVENRTQAAIVAERLGLHRRADD